MPLPISLSRLITRIKKPPDILQVQPQPPSPDDITHTHMSHYYSCNEVPSVSSDPSDSYLIKHLEMENKFLCDTLLKLQTQIDELKENTPPRHHFMVGNTTKEYTQIKKTSRFKINIHITIIPLPNHLVPVHKTLIQHLFIP